jgi:hypothetical protein
MKVTNAVTAVYNDYDWLELDLGVNMVSERGLMVYLMISIYCNDQLRS